MNNNMPCTEPLFEDEDLDSLIRKLRTEIPKEISSWNHHMIQNTPEEELISRVKEKFALRAPQLACDKIELRTDQITVIRDSDYEPDESNLAMGLLVTYVIPFEGDSRLFRYHTAAGFQHMLRARIEGNTLLLDFQAPNNDHDRIPEDFNYRLSLVEKNLDSIKKYCDEFNAGIPRLTRQCVRDRRDALEAQNKAEESLKCQINPDMSRQNED